MKLILASFLLVWLSQSSSALGQEYGLPLPGPTTMNCMTTYKTPNKVRRKADFSIEIPDNLRFTNNEGYLKFYRAKIVSKTLKIDTEVMDRPGMDPVQFAKPENKSIRDLYANDDGNTLFRLRNFLYGIKSDTRVFYRNGDSYNARFRKNHTIDIQLYLKAFDAQDPDYSFSDWRGTCRLNLVPVSKNEKGQTAS
jgi:hypothetical protein